MSGSKTHNEITPFAPKPMKTHHSCFFLLLVSFSPPPTTAKIAICFFMLVSFSPPATQLENVKKLFSISIYLIFKL